MARWHQDRLFIAVGGHIVAIAKDGGRELWRTKLKRTSLVTVSIDKDAVYGGAAGELFCLDPDSGSILWRNTLPGLGLGVVVFGEPAPTLAAAVAAAQSAG